MENHRLHMGRSAALDQLAPGLVLLDLITSWRCAVWRWRAAVGGGAARSTVKAGRTLHRLLIDLDDSIDLLIPMERDDLHSGF
jgi:hypothetical protein